MTSPLLMFGGPMAVMALSGCGGLGDASYGLDPGVASYDTLKTATATCQAKGGEIRLRGGGLGVEGQNLSDYECVIGKAR
jgi:hypothetical protein